MIRNKGSKGFIDTSTSMKATLYDNGLVIIGQCSARKEVIAVAMMMDDKVMKAAYISENGYNVLLRTEMKDYIKKVEKLSIKALNALKREINFIR